MRSNYKQLCEIIRWCDERNRNTETSEVLGVSIGKEYMPTTANIIGTDLSNYKLIRKNRFACNPMHVGRDKVLPIALYSRETPAIVSPAYFTFEVINEDEVLPEYLMLLFRTPIFDKNCWFRTDGTVRGGISWDDLGRVELPVPDIEEQQTIVQMVRKINARVKTLDRLKQYVMEIGIQLVRKESNNTIITCGGEIQAPLLNPGYSYQSIKDFSYKMTSGATPSRQESSYWEAKDVAWLKSGEVQNGICYTPEEFISETALKETSVHLMPADTVLMAMYGATAGNVGYLTEPSTTNQAVCCMQCVDKDYSAYLFFSLLSNREEIKRHANGGAQDNLNKDFIAKIKIVTPPHRRIKKLGLSHIIDCLKLINREKVALTNLRALMSEHKS